MAFLQGDSDLSVFVPVWDYLLLYFGQVMFCCLSVAFNKINTNHHLTLSVLSCSGLKKHQIHTESASLSCRYLDTSRLRRDPMLGNANTSGVSQCEIQPMHMLYAPPPTCSEISGTSALLLSGA